MSFEDDKRPGSVQEIFFNVLMNITHDMHHYKLVTVEYHLNICIAIISVHIETSMDIRNLQEFLQV